MAERQPPSGVTGVRSLSAAPSRCGRVTKKYIFSFLYNMYGGGFLFCILCHMKWGEVHIILQNSSYQRGGVHIFFHICHIAILSYLTYTTYSTYFAYIVSCSCVYLTIPVQDMIYLTTRMTAFNHHEMKEHDSACDQNQSQGQLVSARPFLHAPPVPCNTHFNFFAFLRQSSRFKQACRVHVAIYTST
jgi:hypothetical protein